MNQNDRLIKLANNCTFLDGLVFKDASFCIKSMFLNAALNRFENHTQEDVSNYLGISKRTVSSLEKGKVTNIVTILNYIHYFSFDFATERKKETQRNYYKRKMLRL